MASMADAPPSASAMSAMMGAAPNLCPLEPEVGVAAAHVRFEGFADETLDFDFGAPGTS